MAELTVDSLIARIAEIRNESNALTDAQKAFSEKVRKADEDVKLVLNSPSTSEADAARLQEALAEFIAESYKRAFQNILSARRQTSQQEDLAAAVPGGVSGGFPRLS